MIDIRLQNGSLELGNTATLNITLVNPMFDTDGMPKAYSFPFRIEATPCNLSLLDHANRLDSVHSSDTYPATLFIEGVPFLEGNVVVRERRKNNLQIYFQSTASNFADITKDLSLSELDLDQVTINNVNSAAHTYDIVPLPPPGAGTYSILVNGVTYATSVVPPQDPLVQIDNNIINPINVANGAIAFRIGTQLFLNALNPGDTVDVEYLPAGNFNPAFIYTVSHARMDDWKAYLDAQVSQPISALTHVFPVIKNNRFYDGQNPNYIGYVNYYHNGYPKNTGNNSQHCVAPQIVLKHIFEKSLELVDISSLVGSFFGSIAFTDLIVYNWTALDEVKTELANTVPEDWNHYTMQYNLADYVPDVSVLKLFQALKDLYCLGFFFDNKGTLEVIPHLVLLKTAVEDWTALAEPDYQWTPEKKDGFILDYSRDDSDQMYIEDQLDAQEEAPAKNAFGPDADTTYETLGVDLFGLSKTWLTPEVIQRGSSPEFGIGVQSPHLRFLFYKGLRRDSNADEYPLATNGNKDAVGSSVGSTTLRMQGSGGLYEIYWKDFINLLVNGRPVKKQMRLSIDDLLNIRSFRNPRKKIYHEEGQMVAVVAKVQFKVSNRGIDISTVDFWAER